LIPVQQRQAETEHRLAGLEQKQEETEQKLAEMKNEETFDIVEIQVCVFN
jgi:hypothetical protein